MSKNLSQLVTPFTGIDPAVDLVAMWDASVGKTVPVPIKEFWAPTGTVLPFAGAAAPAGWLFCFGQSVLKATYAALWAVIGTAYGASDTTHFTLPDLRGRVAAGRDNMGGTAANRLGSDGLGDDGSTLGATGGNQVITLDETNLAAHVHNIQVTDQSGAGAGPYVISSDATGTGTLPTDAAGGGIAHGNVQPTIVLNYIIKV